MTQKISEFLIGFYPGSAIRFCDILNILRLERNGCHITDDFLKCIFFKKKSILIRITLKPAHKVTIDNKLSLVQVMAWHQTLATSHYLNQLWSRSLMLYGRHHNRVTMAMTIQMITSRAYGLFSTILQYLQCIGNGDTTVLHKAINVFLIMLR